MINQGEIILYQPNNGENFQIEVRFEEETVWLTQSQMVELFNVSKQNISLHINNIFKEGELQKASTVKEYLIVQNEGSRTVTRKIALYTLDVIISVGYRVKSQRGTQFRIWANKVLKEYLLKGYAIHQRIDKLEKTVLRHDKQFELLIKTTLPPHEGIFYEGQIYDAWEFVSKIIKTAKKSLVLIDNYVDDSILTLLLKRKKGVKATIYSKNVSKQLLLDLAKHNQQYDKIECAEFTKSHDRFLIVDDETVYHIGASLKDLGKSWFAFSKINIDAQELLTKITN